MIRRFASTKKIVLAIACLLLPAAALRPAVAADVLNCKKMIASAAVHVAAEGLGALLATIPDEKERIQFVRDFIDPIRFFADQSGYFYVYDYSCVNVAHAVQKDLQGKNLSNYRDAKGSYVIRELSQKAMAGGGFVEFWWVKPGESVQERKHGYVEPIPDTNWFIGTGVYDE